MAADTDSDTEEIPFEPVDTSRLDAAREAVARALTGGPGVIADIVVFCIPCKEPVTQLDPRGEGPHTCLRCRAEYAQEDVDEAQLDAAREILEDLTGEDIPFDPVDASRLEAAREALARALMGEPAPHQAHIWTRDPAAPSEPGEAPPSCQREGCYAQGGEPSAAEPCPTPWNEAVQAESEGHHG